jgi:hypothetical protein
MAALTTGTYGKASAMAKQDQPDPDEQAAGKEQRQAEKDEHPQARTQEPGAPDAGDNPDAGKGKQE